MIQAAVYFEQHEFDVCLQTCEEAIEKGREVRAPFSLIAKAFARMGNCFAKMGKIDEAILKYEESLTESFSDAVNNKLKKLLQTKRQRDEELYRDPQKAEEAKALGNEKFKVPRATLDSIS